MNKQKFILYALIASLLLNTNSALCENMPNEKSLKSADKQKVKELTPPSSGKSNVKSATPFSSTLQASAEDSKTQYINKDWWDKFHDPILKGYILKSVKDNYDLKVATLKVNQAHAAVSEYLGKEFPSFDLGFNYSRYKTSGSVLSLFDNTQSSYIVPLNVNYEIDLWRKNREATLGMKKELESVQHYEKAAYISLCATVATVYFNIISTDRQIEIQKEIIDLRKNIYEMTKENNKYGLLPTNDVILADRALSDAESALIDLQKRQAILLNQLAVLTGDSSDDSSSLKRTSINKIEIINDLPEKIQSEVVLKRPDVLKAEADLQRARINVSLARKDFLPSFSITGQFGFNSNTFSKTFSWDSYVASIGTGILQSVFTGGQKRARLKAKKYKYQEMIENYQKTILQSFQEVNDSLASLKYDTERNNKNIERLDLERDNMGVINNKYALGAISLLETLQYKERVYSLEKEQIQSKTDCLVDSLGLYKAIGGKL